MADLVESMAVPSAVVVVRSSEFGDATFRFGSRVLGENDLPAPSDHYRIGSITKTMTATVVWQLVQEGKVSLDDPISKYRPDVPNGDNITIAQLLDMRSGLAGYTEDPVFQRAVDEDHERIWNPDELLAMAFSAPASFPPGTAWQYSNTNYILLGLVMEDVTGQSVAELFQERLFDPLGMNSTVMPALQDNSIPAVFAHGYQFGTAEQTFGGDPALSPEQQAAVDGTLLPPDWSGASPSVAGAAGSVISTADDLVVWAKALVDGGLLDAEMQAQRLAAIKPIDPAQPDGPAHGSGMSRVARTSVTVARSGVTNPRWSVIPRPTRRSSPWPVSPCPPMARALPASWPAPSGRICPRAPATPHPICPSQRRARPKSIGPPGAVSRRQLGRVSMV